MQKQRAVYWNKVSGRQSNRRRLTKPRVAYLEQISTRTQGTQEFADDGNTKNKNRALLKEEDINSQSFKKRKRQYGILKEYMKSQERIG